MALPLFVPLHFARATPVPTEKTPNIWYMARPEGAEVSLLDEQRSTPLNAGRL
jgi:hypothetical protein